MVNPPSSHLFEYSFIFLQEFEFGSTSCLFFDTASIIIVTAVIVVVVSVIATVCYFVCCVAKQKRKRTSAGPGGSENENHENGFASNSHSQRLQVSDGSRLDSPKHLPTGHPYQSQGSGQSDSPSPSFEMAQRRFVVIGLGDMTCHNVHWWSSFWNLYCRYPSQAQARLARQQQYAFEQQQAEYRRQQQSTAASAPAHQAARAVVSRQADIMPSEDRRKVAFSFMADSDDPAQVCVF